MNMEDVCKYITSDYAWFILIPNSYKVIKSNKIKDFIVLPYYGAEHYIYFTLVDSSGLF